MTGTSRSGGNRTTSDDNFPMDGMPSRPTDMPAEWNQVWTTLMSQIPTELLRRVDCWQLAILCDFIVKERKLAEMCRLDAEDSQLARAHLQAAQHIAKMSSMFGLSPIDRRRIRLAPQTEGDELDSWAEG